MNDKHILIVDDDVGYGEQLERSLRRRQCSTDLVHDIASALAAATRRVPDAALLDLILFNLIDNAAKYAANSEPPVVTRMSFSSTGIPSEA